MRLRSSPPLGSIRVHRVKTCAFVVSPWVHSFLSMGCGSSPSEHMMRLYVICWGIKVTHGVATNANLCYCRFYYITCEVVCGVVCPDVCIHVLRFSNFPVDAWWSSNASYSWVPFGSICSLAWAVVVVHHLVNTCAFVVFPGSICSLVWIVVVHQVNT